MYITKKQSNEIIKRKKKTNAALAYMILRDFKLTPRQELDFLASMNKKKQKPPKRTEEEEREWKRVYKAMHREQTRIVQLYEEKRMLIKKIGVKEMRDMVRKFYDTRIKESYAKLSEIEFLFYSL